VCSEVHSCTLTVLVRNPDFHVNTPPDNKLDKQNRHRLTPDNNSSAHHHVYEFCTPYYPGSTLPAWESEPTFWPSTPRHRRAHASRYTSSWEAPPSSARSSQGHGFTWLPTKPAKRAANPANGVRSRAGNTESSRPWTLSAARALALALVRRARTRAPRAPSSPARCRWTRPIVIRTAHSTARNLRSKSRFVRRTVR